MRKRKVSSRNAVELSARFYSPTFVFSTFRHIERIPNGIRDGSRIFEQKKIDSSAASRDLVECSISPSPVQVFAGLEKFFGTVRANG